MYTVFHINKYVFVFDAWINLYNSNWYTISKVHYQKNNSVKQLWLTTAS